MPKPAATIEERVLPAEPVTTLPAYEERGGGRGLRAARALAPTALIELITASGLRGRGGGGFPTGKKWRTVADYGAATGPTTVVVNGAEGEPGTFKDRAIMRRNPFAVIEGALIAAHAVGADRAAIAIKQSFTTEHQRLTEALDACRSAGWCEGVNIGVVGGPSEYLFGEETGLLEVLDGRPPFPRIAAPYRQGVEEPGPDPTLVNNVETMANIAAIVADGPEQFRLLGTAESPGTLVCTITGATAKHGVVEVPMGTTLAEVIALVGEGPSPENQRFTAAMSGVANPILRAELFDTPLTYEAMQAVGSGLGAAGFIVFDDTTDFACVAAGVARFLGVESCGQCEPCKIDGMTIADRLARICRNEAIDADLTVISRLLNTVATGARCFLATQHERVVTSIIDAFPEAFHAHINNVVEAREPVVIAPIVELTAGKAEIDVTHARKQPDWTYDDFDSGKTPVERLSQ